MSSLARYAHLGREPNPADALRMAREAWHAHGIVCINPDWLTGWAKQQQARQLAEELFGKRKTA